MQHASPASYEQIIVENIDFPIMVLENERQTTYHHMMCSLHWHEQLEIQRLRTELNDVKYEALARSRELMEKSRESNIQKYIEEQGSALQASTQPPVVIKK